MALAALPLSPVHAAGPLSSADLQTKVTSTRAALAGLAERLQNAELTLEDAEDAVAQHRRLLQQSETRRQALEGAIQRQAVRLYMIGNSFDIESLLASDDLSTAVDRLRYLHQIELGQRAMLEEVGALRRHAREQSGQLEGAMRRAQASLGEATARRTELTKRLREYSQLLQYAGQGRTVIRASRTGIRGFVCPVVGPVAFGHSFGQRRPGHIHKGVDMMGDYGQTLVAVLPGRIVSLDGGSGYGLTVLLRDIGGDEWLYAHMQSRSVRVGDSVVPGEVVGKMGCTGRCYGPHVHFEWHPGGGAAHDPYSLLDSAC